MSRIPKFDNFNGKLDRMSFISGVEFLSTFYSTFRFWNEDFDGQVELRKQIWYETFKDMDGYIFKQLTHAYCKDNVFAPQSPTQLLDYGKKRLIGIKPTAEKAYSIVKDIVRKNGHYFLDTDDEIERLEDDAIKEAYKQTKTLFVRAWENTYNEPECRRNFISVYNGLLDVAVTNDKVIDLLNDTKGRALFIRGGENDSDYNYKSKSQKELLEDERKRLTY